MTAEKTHLFANLLGTSLGVDVPLVASIDDEVTRFEMLEEGLDGHVNGLSCLDEHDDGSIHTEQNKNESGRREEGNRVRVLLYKETKSNNK